jgi:argininosuccinate lyase
MPHKKNPDVFEIIRGRCNQIAALPNDIALMTANLPSGYHREMQLLKEILFPAIQNLKDCLRMAQLMLTNIDVKQGIVNDDKYKFLFSVEEVNKLVLAGMPFRDAYKKIGLDIEQGKYKPETSVKHTHEGSIGNLCLPEISAMMEDLLAKFNFKSYQAAISKLVS